MNTKIQVNFQIFYGNLTPLKGGKTKKICSWHRVGFFFGRGIFENSRSGSRNSLTTTPDFFEFVKNWGISGVKFQSSKYDTIRHFCALYFLDAIIVDNDCSKIFLPVFYFKFVKNQEISGVKFKSSKYETIHHFCAFQLLDAIFPENFSIPRLFPDKNFPPPKFSKFPEVVGFEASILVVQP